MPKIGSVRQIIIIGRAVLGLLISMTTNSQCAARTKAAVLPDQHGFLRCASDVRDHPEPTGEERQRLDPKLVADLIAWVHAKTRWNHCAPPAIDFVPDAKLRKMFVARSRQTKAAQVDALYSRQDDTVYLPTDWNARDVHDRAALQHELIHHLQVTNKVEVTCSNEYEFQAYSLTIDWLREQGVEKPLKMLQINDVALFMLSQCSIY